jgi:hypothetical protein
MEKRITKKDNYETLREIVVELGREDLVQFLDHEIELVSKKRTNVTKTKTQIENEEYKKAIVKILENTDKALTITEIQDEDSTLAELSNQKVSALLKQLVDSNIVVKTFDKKKAYFNID